MDQHLLLTTALNQDFASDFKLKSLVGNKDALSQISSFISVVLCTIHIVLNSFTLIHRKITKSMVLVMEICIKPMWWKKKYILCLCFWIGCWLPKCPRISTCGQATEYLVELRGHTALSLTNQEANTVIALWQNLDDRDKKRVVYAARHQKRLQSGCFQSTKDAHSTPGVESTTRSVLGTSSAPAQWPDCCRLVETIFIRLCTIHPSPKEKARERCREGLWSSKTTEG